jgi:GNAT superfamily N-acetyltransferase
MAQGEAITIRRAAVGDVAGMGALLRELFAIEEDFTFDAARVEAGLRLLAEPGERHCVLVAENACGGEGENLVGMVSAQLLVSTAEGGLKALIEDLVVAEAARAQGVGRALLAAIEQWAAGAGVRRCDLLMDRYNEAAARFYDRNGWRATRLVARQKRVRG